MEAANDPLHLTCEVAMHAVGKTATGGSPELPRTAVTRAASHNAPQHEHATAANDTTTVNRLHTTGNRRLHPRDLSPSSQNTSQRREAHSKLRERRPSFIGADIADAAIEAAAAALEADANHSRNSRLSHGGSFEYGFSGFGAGSAIATTGHGLAASALGEIDGAVDAYLGISAGPQRSTSLRGRSTSGSGASGTLLHALSGLSPTGVGSSGSSYSPVRARGSRHGGGSPVRSPLPGSQPNSQPGSRSVSAEGGSLSFAALAQALESCGDAGHAAADDDCAVSSVIDLNEDHHDASGMHHLRGVDADRAQDEADCSSDDDSVDSNDNGGDGIDIGGNRGAQDARGSPSDMQSYPGSSNDDDAARQAGDGSETTAGTAEVRRTNSNTGSVDRYHLHYSASAASSSNSIVVAAPLAFASPAGDLASQEINGHAESGALFERAPSLSSSASSSSSSSISTYSPLLSTLEAEMWHRLNNPSLRGRPERVPHSAVTQDDAAWADGPSCQHCSSKFTMLKRRHHCRACGSVLCRNCSPYDYQPSLPASSTRVRFGRRLRMCQRCHALQSGRILRGPGQPQSDIISWLDSIASGELLEIETRIQQGQDVNAICSDDGLSALHVAVGHACFAAQAHAHAQQLQHHHLHHHYQLDSQSQSAQQQKQSVLSSVVSKLVAGSTSPQLQPASLSRGGSARASPPLGPSFAPDADGSDDGSSGRNSRGSVPSVALTPSAAQPVQAPSAMGSSSSSTGAGLSNGPRVPTVVRSPFLSSIGSSIGSIGSVLSAAAGKLANISLAGGSPTLNAQQLQPQQQSGNGFGFASNGGGDVSSDGDTTPRSGAGALASSSLSSLFIGVPGAASAPGGLGNTRGGARTALGRATAEPQFDAADAERTCLAVVKMLISSGADVNAQTFSRRTPLHCCSMYGTVTAAQLLLDAGALQGALDKNGLSPYDYAAIRAARGDSVGKALVDRVLDVTYSTGAAESHSRWLAACSNDAARRRSVAGALVSRIAQQQKVLQIQKLQAAAAAARKASDASGGQQSPEDNNEVHSARNISRQSSHGSKASDPSAFSPQLTISAAAHQAHLATERHRAPAPAASTADTSGTATSGATSASTTPSPGSDPADLRSSFAAEAVPHAAPTSSSHVVDDDDNDVDSNPFALHNNGGIVSTLSSGANAATGLDDDAGDGEVIAGVATGEGAAVLSEASQTSRADSLPLPPRSQVLAMNIGCLEPPAQALQANLMAVRNSYERWLNEHAWLDRFQPSIRHELLSTCTSAATRPSYRGWLELRDITIPSLEVSSAAVPLLAPSQGPSSSSQADATARLARQIEQPSSLRTRVSNLELLQPSSRHEPGWQRATQLVGQAWALGHPRLAFGDVTDLIEASFARVQTSNYVRPVGLRYEPAIGSVDDDDEEGGDEEEEELEEGGGSEVEADVYDEEEGGPDADDTIADAARASGSVGHGAAAAADGAVHHRHHQPLLSPILAPGLIRSRSSSSNGEGGPSIRRNRVSSTSSITSSRTSSVGDAGDDKAESTLAAIRARQMFYEGLAGGDDSAVVLDHGARPNGNGTEATRAAAGTAAALDGAIGEGTTSHAGTHEANRFSSATAEASTSVASSSGSDVPCETGVGVESEHAALASVPLLERNCSSHVLHVDLESFVAGTMSLANTIDESGAVAVIDGATLSLPLVSGLAPDSASVSVLEVTATANITTERQPDQAAIVSDKPADAPFPLRIQAALAQSPDVDRDGGRAAEASASAQAAALQPPALQLVATSNSSAHTPLSSPASLQLSPLSLRRTQSAPSNSGEGSSRRLSASESEQSPRSGQLSSRSLRREATSPPMPAPLTISKPAANNTPRHNIQGSNDEDGDDATRRPPPLGLTTSASAPHGLAGLTRLRIISDPDVAAHVRAKLLQQEVDRETSESLSSMSPHSGVGSGGGAFQSGGGVNCNGGLYHGGGGSGIGLSLSSNPGSYVDLHSIGSAGNGSGAGLRRSSLQLGFGRSATYDAAGNRTGTVAGLHASNSNTMYQAVLRRSCLKRSASLITTAADAVAAGASAASADAGGQASTINVASGALGSAAAGSFEQGAAQDDRQIGASDQHSDIGEARPPLHSTPSRFIATVDRTAMEQADGSARLSLALSGPIAISSSSTDVFQAGYLSNGGPPSVGMQLSPRAGDGRSSLDSAGKSTDLGSSSGGLLSSQVADAWAAMPRSKLLTSPQLPAALDEAGAGRSYLSPPLQPSGAMLASPVLSGLAALGPNGANRLVSADTSSSQSSPSFSGSGLSSSQSGSRASSVDFAQGATTPIAIGPSVPSSSSSVSLYGAARSPVPSFSLPQRRGSIASVSSTGSSAMKRSVSFREMACGSIVTEVFSYVPATIVEKPGQETPTPKVASASASSSGASSEGGAGAGDGDPHRPLTRHGSNSSSSSSGSSSGRSDASTSSSHSQVECNHDRDEIAIGSGYDGYTRDIEVESSDDNEGNEACSGAVDCGCFDTGSASGSVYNNAVNCGIVAPSDCGCHRSGRSRKQTKQRSPHIAKRRSGSPGGAHASGSRTTRVQAPAAPAGAGTSNGDGLGCARLVARVARAKRGSPPLKPRQAPLPVLSSLSPLDSGAAGVDLDAQPRQLQAQHLSLGRTATYSGAAGANGLAPETGDDLHTQGADGNAAPSNNHAEAFADDAAGKVHRHGHHHHRVHKAHTPPGHTVGSAHSPVTGAHDSHSTAQLAAASSSPHQQQQPHSDLGSPGLSLTRGASDGGAAINSGSPILAGAVPGAGLSFGLRAAASLPPVSSPLRPKLAANHAPSAPALSMRPPPMGPSRLNSSSGREADDNLDDEDDGAGGGPRVGGLRRSANDSASTTESDSDDDGNGYRSDSSDEPSDDDAAGAPKARGGPAVASFTPKMLAAMAAMHSKAHGHAPGFPSHMHHPAASAGVATANAPPNLRPPVASTRPVQ